MINEELIHRASAILLSRYNHWENVAQKCVFKGETAAARACAYKSAYDILWYAINGNEECLKEFDYYDD